MNERVSSSPTDGWRLGLYRRNKMVEFHNLELEVDARTLYAKETYSSKVLLQILNKDDTEENVKLILCSTATWDVDGIGVATLLCQNMNSTEQDIRDEISNGTLPFVPPQRSIMTQAATKAAVSALFQRRTVEFFGAAPYRLSKSSLCYFDVTRHPNVRGYVALTIDDVPCRFPDRYSSSSELARVLDVLQQYKAKATFMVIGSWCTAAVPQQQQQQQQQQKPPPLSQRRQDLIRLLQEGHELGNHGMMDRSYEFDSPPEFEAAVDQCSAIIQELQKEAGIASDFNDMDDPNNHPSAGGGVRWFRAPHGRYTREMAAALERRGLTNVMCDTYASCPVIQDANYISTHLSDRCQDGSIILLHTPEVHVRQWCFDAMVGLLERLNERHFKVVTVSELSRLAASSAPAK
jgi:peptidoglycan/xylan/chitin deacetylase (PgdA/CDA1 family)